MWVLGMEPGAAGPTLQPKIVVPFFLKAEKLPSEWGLTISRASLKFTWLLLHTLPEAKSLHPGQDLS